MELVPRSTISRDIIELRDDSIDQLKTFIPFSVGSLAFISAKEWRIRSGQGW